MKMKRMEMRDITVGEYQFKIRPFGARDATYIFGDVASIILPILGTVSVASNDKDAIHMEMFDGMDMDKDSLVKALGRIDGRTLSKLVNELLLSHSNVRVLNPENGVYEVMNEDAYDEIFCQYLAGMLILCAEVIRLNFSGFFSDASTLFGRLFKVRHRLDVLVTIFDSLLGGRAKDNHNFCGGTGSMLSFAPDGSAYPCIRYAPISIGEEKSKKVRFGSVYDGLYTTDSQRKAKAELDAITLTSQSEQKCIDCPVSAGCGWCSGLNYEMYGTANKRFTGICWAHKARVLASAYYHNRRYIEIGDCLPIKAELPKDDALEILPAADYEEFLKIERAALLKFADENGIG